jgi:hypothetical protein
MKATHTRSTLDRTRDGLSWVLRGLVLTGLSVAAGLLSTVVIAQAAPTGSYSPTVRVLCGPPDQQYFPFIDLNGLASDYTFANGAHPCVRVDWYFEPLPKEKNCTISFYVPNGNANAYLPVGLIDVNGQKTYFRFSEDPVNGPVQVFSKNAGEDVPINHVNIGDNNGESYPTMIGWGATDSVQVNCFVDGPFA